MSKIFYIADTHFGHKDIIAFDNRPFFDVKDMEETIIKNWNSVVRSEDTVYILGDVFWNFDFAKQIELTHKLNGYHIRIIAGNHDDGADIYSNYTIVEDEGRYVVLCHYPIMFYKNMVILIGITYTVTFMQLGITI